MPNTFVLTRREVLRLFGAAGPFFFLGGRMTAGTLMPATNAVDHLLLGVADLDHGIDWVERKTGVRPVVGGSHPGAGTRNALISLGGRQYLEVIAPDPTQTVYTFPIDIRKLAEPRLVTWASVTTDIDGRAKQAREAGSQVMGPLDGSRARPDGKLLKWKTLRVTNQFGLQGVEPVPFFIQWAADSLHPSQDSPKGCELQSFEIEHPDAERLTEVLKKLGIEAKVRRAGSARLIATLKTPKGELQLS